MKHRRGDSFRDSVAEFIVTVVVDNHRAIGKVTWPAQLDSM
jgi:hypothetical protein